MKKHYISPGIVQVRMIVEQFLATGTISQETGTPPTEDSGAELGAKDFHGMWEEEEAEDMY